MEVLPVDVQASGWESGLEAVGRARPAVRLGLNMVFGLAQDASFRIEEARAIQPFADIHDLALRVQLNRLDPEKLAGANALASLAGHRRQALWQAVAGAPNRGLLKPAAIVEEDIQSPAPSEGYDIVSDYRSLGLTLWRHPLALLLSIFS